jgi:hypothetical protein
LLKQKLKKENAEESGKGLLWQGDVATAGLHGNGGTGAADDSLDAILQRRDIEVDEKPNLDAAEVQVRGQLSIVDGQQALHRLQLDQDTIVHDQVGLYPLSIGSSLYWMGTAASAR